MKSSHCTNNLRNYTYQLRKGDVLQPGLPHERQKLHPNEAHQDDEKSINIIYMFYA